MFVKIKSKMLIIYGIFTIQLPLQIYIFLITVLE